MDTVLEYAHCDGNCNLAINWTSQQADPALGSGQWPSLALNPANPDNAAVAIAHYDAGLDRLKYSTGAIGWNTITIPNTQGMGKYASLVRAPLSGGGDQPWIAFQDHSVFGLETLMLATKPPGQGWGWPAGIPGGVLDGTDESGHWASAIADSTGRVLVSHQVRDTPAKTSEVRVSRYDPVDSAWLSCTHVSAGGEGLFSAPGKHSNVRLVHGEEVEGDRILDYHTQP